MNEPQPATLRNRLEDLSAHPMLLRDASVRNVHISAEIDAPLLGHSAELATELAHATGEVIPGRPD